jgi:nucleolar protein 56
MLKLKSFAPFKNAADALENANDVSEGNIEKQLVFHKYITLFIRYR